MLGRISSMLKAASIASRALPGQPKPANLITLLWSQVLLLGLVFGCSSGLLGGATLRLGLVTLIVLLMMVRPVADPMTFIARFSPCCFRLFEPCLIPLCHLIRAIFLYMVCATTLWTQPRRTLRRLLDQGCLFYRVRRCTQRCLHEFPFISPCGILLSLRLGLLSLCPLPGQSTTSATLINSAQFKVSFSLAQRG